MVNEVRAIPAHPKYGVTKNGNVWSKVKNGQWKELAQSMSTRGYPKVKLTGGYTALVHILVAEMFIGPRPTKLRVNLIDGDKLNNSSDNLRYITQAASNKHAWLLGLQRNGWPKRRARLAMMGAVQWGSGGSYPVEADGSVCV
jgi:hypothetical protein